MLSVSLLAAGAAYSNLTPLRGTRGSVCLVVLATGFVLLLALSEKDGDLAFEALLAFAFIAGAFSRKCRALLAPLVCIAFIFLLTLFATFFALTPGTCANVLDAIEAGGVSPVIVSTSMVAIAIPFYAATRVPKIVLCAYRAGIISDISLMAALGVSLATFLIVLAADGPKRPLWHLVLVWLAWVAAIIGGYVTTLGRIAKPAATRTLLMLRVFSSTTRQRDLLENLQTQWRYFGPILEIGGPDLATLNVDARKVVQYLAGTGHEEFLRGGTLLLGADREGRFHVNEVFCLQSNWQATVGSLMEISDVILMDLRGFKSGRSGVEFELELLIKTSAIDRAVLVGDKETQWLAVGDIVGPRAGARICEDTDVFAACMDALQAKSVRDRS
ncbi:hypothetical protein HLB44_30405 [Aquincola sp. S2]|uniref:Uncharacterized protein n=2 Tax=Pseudaquabacterium terrae TaxID=2732868 RepID=A0ABX2ERH1_9BURK|nr:hypothetical protein [Aquabacterium terrae]